MSRSQFRRYRHCIGVFAFSLVGLLCSTLYAQSTYYIDEDTDYSNSNKCDIGDVNDITSSLQAQLVADSWAGLRYSEFSAWPQDFWEASSSVYGTSGVDSSYGDAYALSVMAGHGSPHTLYFSNTGNGGIYNGDTQCTVDFNNNARMGKLAGAAAGFGMWLVCESIQTSELSTVWYQHRFQQIAGWMNSIGIGDDEPRDFYLGTGSSTNATAWINQMADANRQAIIVTFSDRSQSDCWGIHNRAQLRAGQTYLAPLSSDPAFYCYST